MDLYMDSSIVVLASILVGGELVGDLGEEGDGGIAGMLVFMVDEVNSIFLAFALLF
jgi:hypothetical protein